MDFRHDLVELLEMATQVERARLCELTKLPDPEQSEEVQRLRARLLDRLRALVNQPHLPREARVWRVTQGPGELVLPRKNCMPFPCRAACCRSVAPS
jgi:hypothetical protein